MNKMWMCCCFFLMTLNSTASEQQQLTECDESEKILDYNLNENEINQNKTDRTHHCHNPQCQHYQKENDKEKELQELAITTLANMAQGILAIGWDPNNPTNVANNVTNIVGNFAHFVAHAARTKSINIEELFTNEEFIFVCKQILINNIESTLN